VLVTRRLWGLSARQSAALFAAAALVGVVVALVLGPTPRPDPSAAKAAAGVARVEPGTPGPARAVWVFGFETIRLDPHLRAARQLAITGFGYVAGHDGVVYMYNPSSGQVGVLDARTNRLHLIAALPPGTTQRNLFVPTIAAHGTDLWLVSTPGQLTRLDLGTKQADPPIELASHSSAAPPSGAIATGVVVTPQGVVTATQWPEGIDVARIDPATHSVAGHVLLDAPDAVSLDGLATDGAHVWVVAGNTIHQLEVSTLTPSGAWTVPGQPPGSTRGAVTAAGEVWTLTDAGATLAHLDPRTGTLTSAARLLEQAPGVFRTPASLVTDGQMVWAMVQRGRTPNDRTARVVGFDPARQRPTRGIDVPSRVFAGALAVSSPVR